MAANNRGLLLDMVEALYETQGEEGVARMVDAYMVALDSCYGVYTEGMTEDAQRELAMLYLEEIFADQYAGMNRSSTGARQAVETAGDVAQRFAGDIENARQNRAGIDRRNGPGVRFSQKSKNNTKQSATSPLSGRLSQGKGSIGTVNQVTAAAELLGISESITDAKDSVKTAIVILKDFYQAIQEDRPLTGMPKKVTGDTLLGYLCKKKLLTRQGGQSAYRIDDNHTLRISDHSANSSNFQTPDNLSVVLKAPGKLNNFYDDPGKNVVEVVYSKKYLNDNPNALQALIADIGNYIATGKYRDSVPGRNYNLSGNTSSILVNGKTWQQLNDDYLDVVKRNDMEAAQRMVDEAAKRAGFSHKGFHQTGADFTSFSTKNEVAGQFDDETPTGIFIKPTDEDIGLQSGTKQMPLYFKADNMLEFANREEIRKYWIENVQGYRELDAQLQARNRELEQQYDELDAEWNRIYQETYDSDDQSALDEVERRQDEFLERWNRELQPLRRQMKNLVTEYMKGTDYDGIHLKYDGKVYGGPRVETYIVFNPNQVKSAEPIARDNQGNVIPLSERFRTDRTGEETWKNRDIRYSDRDYSLPSDLELMEQAAEGLTEAGGEEYWKALLEQAPELAGDEAKLKQLAKDYRAQAKRLAQTQERLEQAKRELHTTRRAVNPKGIGQVVQQVAKDFEVSDPKQTKLLQRAGQRLAELYQAALDQIDSGAELGDAWQTVYNGAVEIAELLLDEGRFTQNNSGRWTNVPYAQYIGEERQSLIDAMTSAVAVDFTTNRYRGPIRETAADRLVARTQREMQKKVDAAREKAAGLQAENERLKQDQGWMQKEAEDARAMGEHLRERLTDLKEELKTGKVRGSQERKKAQGKIDRLQKQVLAKQAEARAWQARAQKNASLLEAALCGDTGDSHLRSLRLLFPSGDCVLGLAMV